MEAGAGAEVADFVELAHAGGARRREGRSTSFAGGCSLGWGWIRAGLCAAAVTDAPLPLAEAFAAVCLVGIRQGPQGRRGGACGREDSNSDGKKKKEKKKKGISKGSEVVLASRAAALVREETV